MRITSKGEQVYRFNQVFFQKKAHKNYKDTTDQLKKIIKSFFIFNISFFSLFFVEIISFIILFPIFDSSTLLALLLAGIFLTAFTYFVLLFYFQSKKNEQIVALKDRFIKVCKRALSIPIGSAEHHLTIALASLKLSENLSKLENIIPKILLFTKKISSFFLKQDIFKFKELLLTAAIDEHLEQLKLTPTDLEVHASLANIYTNLSSLYLNAKTNVFFSNIAQSHLNQKYEACITSNLEEFKILNDYAPNDPWIHLQLAMSYNKLNLKKEQIKEYEIIYKLCPNDNNVLFKLGALYFETKRNSKGLRIYEELLMRSFKDASKLLTYYGAYKTQEIFSEPV
ncbi:MAG: hypothetical protein K940chlam1_00134 [Candidatus Anoxychlamydiales bacterium]|nr:hypothetical protein [Candidatus Anoxychlamydiales bacterium]NGX35202.1 hypothetical protein [Candidatus Anoxychlamydiales bacterium]